MMMRGKPVVFKVDSGDDISAISMQDNEPDWNIRAAIVGDYKYTSLDECLSGL